MDAFDAMHKEDSVIYSIPLSAVEKKMQNTLVPVTLKDVLIPLRGIVYGFVGCNRMFWLVYNDKLVEVDACCDNFVRYCYYHTRTSTFIFSSK